MIRRLLAAAVTLHLWIAGPGVVADDPYPEGYVGPDACETCHRAEIGAWKNTEHFRGYARLHKHARLDSILTTVAGKSSPRKNWTCTSCHYTMVSTRGRNARAVAGVSCESCHGPGERWIDTHWRPGPYMTHDREPPEHKRQRLADAAQYGMIHSSMLYDLARQCQVCHGLARDDVPADKLALMFDAGHPMDPGFELVAYSQGTIRHHLDGTAPEPERTPLELARLFVIGAAAKLVSASNAAGKVDHPKYAAAQKRRADDARAAIAAVAHLPEAKALLADPSDANARKLAAAVQEADVLQAVRALLPSKADYR